MAFKKLFLDSNTIIDYIARRDPFFDGARLLMMCGSVGEFDLWAASSQFTDVVYIASEGERKKLLPKVQRQLQALRRFVNVCPVAAKDIDRMLSSAWGSPEDALLHDLALGLHVDAIITRDADFSQAIRQAGAVDAFTADELFEHLRTERNVTYTEVAFPASAG